MRHYAVSGSAARQRTECAIVGLYESGTLSAAAAQVDAQFTARKVLLASLANTVAESDGASPAAMQAFVARHPVARGRFLNLHIYNRQGALLNTGGGALGEGRLHGMTQMIESVLQVTDRAGERQVPGASRAIATISNGLTKATAFAFSRDG